jgi:hypothetical protein
MSDPAAYQPGTRPLPQTTLQFAGHAAENVVSGLSGRSPYMLGIVVLNVLGIAAAIYFLNVLITGQQNHLANLLTLQQHDQEQLLLMHKDEFNQLLQMIPRAPGEPVPVTPIAPSMTTVPPSGGKR